MSPVMLLLILLAVTVASLIIYGGVRLYRSAVIDDEIAERIRLEEEAKHLEEMEKLYPGFSATQNKDKRKRFLNRS